MGHELQRRGLSKPVAIVMLVGVLLACLVVLWNGSRRSVGPFGYHPLNDAEDARGPFSHAPSAEEVRVRGIAVAEVLRREGWSGKVIAATKQADAWYVFVERERSEDPGVRHIRAVDVEPRSGRVVHYRTVTPTSLP